MTSDRRSFLKFVAGSPWVAALGGLRAYAQRSPEIASAISDPKGALNVMDFEEAARRRVLPGHWAYMASGVDDDGTLRANSESYRHIQLRPSRLHDATKVDTRADFSGTVYNSPIFTCPTGGEGSFHADGELAVARATKARGTLQILSTATSTGVEDVNAAHGRPVWYQLYAPSKWEALEHIVHRVEAAGCPVIALTVDNTTGRNSETFNRTRPKDTATCSQCHGPNGPNQKDRKMYQGIDMTGVSGQNPAMTWEFVDRLRKLVKVKLYIKGIDTKQDAGLAIEHGFDGILVSNHGGRSDRNTAGDDSGASRSHLMRSRGTDSGFCRWRRAAQNRCVQGACTRRKRSRNRSPVPLGTGGIRTAWSRPSPRNPAG